MVIPITKNKEIKNNICLFFFIFILILSRVGLCNNIEKLSLSKQMASPSKLITLYDDTNVLIQLTKPAQRIISLAPHITELLFAAGAGNQIVGVSRFSDYPSAAKKIPIVSDYRIVDLEAILALHPDLIITWTNQSRKQLEKLAIPIYVSNSKKILDIETTLRHFGQLTGTEASAITAAQKFHQRYEQLKQHYSQQPSIKVFYQIWTKPLLTVGHDSLITQLITLCGGSNLFDNITNPAPQINVEAVLAANPDVIIASEHEQNWQTMWLQWPQLKAVQAHAIYSIDPALLQRFGPRILDGAEILCTTLAKARLMRINTPGLFPSN